LAVIQVNLIILGKFATIFLLVLLFVMPLLLAYSLIWKERKIRKEVVDGFKV